jgi:parallel beta-helix repeat protein
MSGTGTDNTTALQNAINSLQTAGTCGQVLLQAKIYKVTGTLNITSPCVGVKGAELILPSSTQYTNPPASVIITTSATADVIDVAGTGLTANVFGNRFENFTIARSLTPTGTAAGLSLSYTYGVYVNRVFVEDSVRGFYIHASGSQGVGVIENSGAELGYNGFVETSGAYSGFYVDSQDGKASPSIRARHNFVASNLGATPTVYGWLANGTALNDQMVYGFETAGVSYGVYLQNFGGGTNFSSGDLHFYGSIFDATRISNIFVSGFTAATNGHVEFNGGYALAFAGGAGAHNFDIENSSGVNITNMQIGPFISTATDYVFISGGGNNSVTNNSLSGVGINGITLSSTTGNTIHGNQVVGSTATGSLIGLTASSNNSISANTLSGTAAKGLSVDSSSSNNTGLETNSIASTITIAQSNAGNNPVVISGVAGGQSVISTVFNEGTVGANITGTNPATDVPGTSWTTWPSLASVQFKSGGGAISNATSQGNIIDTGILDYVLTYSGVTNTSGESVVFRWVGSTGADRFQINMLGAGGVQLQEAVTGTLTTVGTSAVSAGATGSIVITVNGNSVNVVPFGGTAINYTIPAGHADLTGTKIGLFAGTSGYTFGGISVVSTTNVAKSLITPSVTLASYTVSTLPAAATLGAGTSVIVSDGAGTPPTCTGGGSNYQIAISNGAAWTCH